MENKELNLCEILKDCPTGTKFWSPVWGDVTFVQINDVGVFPIVLSAKSFSNSNISLRSNGKMYDIKEAECLLYPSKYQRDWSKFVRFWDEPDVSKFDVETFHPFDKVLVRDYYNERWRVDIFGFMLNDCICCCTTNWRYCIPYNEETKNLIGTTDDWPEFYEGWEN